MNTLCIYSLGVCMHVIQYAWNHVIYFLILSKISSLHVKSNHVKYVFLQPVCVFQYCIMVLMQKPSLKSFIWVKTTIMLIAKTRVSSINSDGLECLHIGIQNKQKYTCLPVPV